MTNKERLEKLEQAEKLVRDVEFSYELGSLERRSLYKAVVDSFSFIGPIGQLVTELKDRIRQEQRETK